MALTNGKSSLKPGAGMTCTLCCVSQRLCCFSELYFWNHRADATNHHEVILPTVLKFPLLILLRSWLPLKCSKAVCLAKANVTMAINNGTILQKEE